MSLEVAVAETLVHDKADPAPTPATTPWDRSPESLALVLAKTAERVRTDPPANFTHCAVRAATAVLRARINERLSMSPGAARDATEETVTVAAGEVEVRWLPGLGSCPGAVDLTTIGPLGPVAKAVTLPEALAACAAIDLLCPASNWHQTLSTLAAGSTNGRER